MEMTRTELAVALSLAVDGATAELAEAFRERGIGWLLLKGPAVSTRLYVGTHRPYVDVDAFVQPSDYAAAESVLGSLGYDAAPHSPRRAVEHAETWRRDGALWSVDLHRRIPHVPAGADTTWQAFHQRTRALEVAAETVTVCDDDALALLLALHALHHAPGGIKPATDLALAVGQLPRAAWQGAAALARQLGAERNLAAALTLSGEGAALRAELGLPAVGRREVALRSGEPARLSAAMEALAEARGFQTKLQVVWEELVVRDSPRAAELAARYRTDSSMGMTARRIGHVVRSAPGAVAAWFVLRRDRRALRDLPPERGTR